MHHGCPIPGVDERSGRPTIYVLFAFNVCLQILPFDLPCIMVTPFDSLRHPLITRTLLRTSLVGGRTFTLRSMCAGLRKGPSNRYHLVLCLRTLTRDTCGAISLCISYLGRGRVGEWLHASLSPIRYREHDHDHTRKPCLQTERGRVWDKSSRCGTCHP